jgi:uncharacterized membrane protein
MGLNFTKPYLLLLIPIFIGFIIFTASFAVRINKKKRIWFILTRSLVITFLILSLCGTSFYWRLNDTTTIFLVDASDSIGNSKEELQNVIKEAVKLKGKNDKVGVVSFGGNAAVESFISKDGAFEKIEGNINTNYTNIENAVASAISLFPDDSNKRLVLLTDGEENQGALSKMISSLGEQKIEIKYYNKLKEEKEEVALENLSVPQKMVLDEEFNLGVTVKSTVATSAKLSIFSGRTKIGEEKVELQKGVNKYVFRDKALEGGFKGYKVTIEADKDVETKNNESSAFTFVSSKPKILVIQDNEKEGKELINMLQASSVDFTLVNSKVAPRSLSEMSAYKSIITCNVSADNLNEGFLNALESYVKDFGGGFIATGGEDSFALGGYSNTPLEKVLPVYMDMRGKKEIPKMAMVLIIDHSGSMSEGMGGISKVDMAKEAAIRSLSSLRVGKDEIGVLAFDSAYSWVVKRKVIDNIKSIEADIGTIRPEGGTSILPALLEGYKSLKDSDAKVKHIILLTDGQAEKDGYDSLIRDINKENITVSTVAVGLDADKDLLQNISKSCGGRFYITDEYTNIPRIFSKETFMAARMYLNNREFTPKITASHNILNGVAEGGLPSLLGYVGSSQKETARVILQSDEEDPILTAWQYGLGKTVAWNSDLAGKWNANYVGWDKNLKLWQNIINYTIENYDNENASIEVKEEAGKTLIKVKDKKAEEELETGAIVVNSMGEQKEVKLLPTAPGEYSGTVDLPQSGVYMISGKQSKNGELINSVSTGYSLQYSPEYKLKEEDNKIDKVLEAAGAKFIDSPDKVFTTELERKKGQRDLSNLLLILVLLLFFLDIAIRKLRINTSKLREHLKEKLALVPILKPLFSASSRSNVKHKDNEGLNLNSINESLNKNKTRKNRNLDKAKPEVESFSMNTSQKTSKEKYSEEFKAEENTIKARDKAKKEPLKEEVNFSTSSGLDTSKLLKNKRFK